VHSAFLSLVTLTFNLDTETRPSEGPDVSRRVRRKSVQQFPKYLIHKQKTNKKSQTVLYLRAVITKASVGSKEVLKGLSEVQGGLK